MWSTSSMDARADARRAQRRRTNGDSPRSRVAPLAAEGLLWTAAERVALQRGEDLKEAEARNAVVACGWMDGMCLRRVREEVVATRVPSMSRWTTSSREAACHRDHHHHLISQGGAC